MPVIEPTTSTPPVFYPQVDYRIVKYMDITRFVSLLSTSALFFCRLDKLEDKFEGTTAKANFQGIVQWYKALGATLPPQERMTDDEINQRVIEHFQNELRFKPSLCVNCWNKKDEESAALWKIYSDFSKGIMIKSSIAKLRNSLNDAPEHLYLSEIRYQNYETEQMPFGNFFFPAIHKQNAYSYENEIRVIYQVESDAGINYDWSKEEVEEGKYINVNIDVLIDEIIISPYAPKWFFTLIKDLLVKYNIQKPVNKSQFSFEPL